MFCLFVMFSLFLLFTNITCIIYNSCNKEKTVAFSFDQGPTQYTGMLLDILKSHNIKATFHFQSDNLSHPLLRDYAIRASNEGHTIGIYVSLKEAKKTTHEIIEEFLKGILFLSTIIQKTPVYVRISEGIIPKEIRRIVGRLGLILTKPSLKIKDDIPSDVSVWNSFITGIEADKVNLNRWIIKQNEESYHSVMATERIISDLTQKGNTFVPVDICIQVDSETK